MEENMYNKLLLLYSTSHLNSTDKVKFYYALKGRDGKSGIVKQLNIRQLAKSVLLVDHHHQEDITSFFKVIASSSTLGSPSNLEDKTNKLQCFIYLYGFFLKPISLTFSFKLFFVIKI